MAKSLVATIKAHCTQQGSQGVKTLSLIAVCLEHMQGESGDWTPLATLIGNSQPAQGRIIHKITESILLGYKITKDPKQDSGIRISKVKETNQGFNELTYGKLVSLIEEKATLQGAAVKDYFMPKVEKPAFSVDTYAGDIIKKLTKEDCDLDALIAALMAVQAAQVEAAKIAA